jgi:tetratricopeptide (TPR) repeat protein
MQALRINPNSSMIHNNYSAMLIFTRRFEEAISEAKRARELDPLSGFISSRTGLALTYAGQCDRAIEEYKVALKLDPDHFFIHFNLGNAYYKKAMFKAAMTEYKKAVDLSNGTSFAITMLAVVYYQLGKKDHAEKLFERLKKRSETEYVDAASFYMIHRARGEEDLAFECLKRGCNEHDSFILWLRPDPLFVPEDSRYMALLQEFGL